jgi:circadian clock protein KaiB
MHVFRLYVAGRSLNSAHALDNLQALCRQHLPDAHEVEVVDILSEPGRALREGVLVTPTLVRLRPGPVVRIIGNLGQKQTVLTTLGLEATGA